jgi:hypothetical protein
MLTTWSDQMLAMTMNTTSSSSGSHQIIQPPDTISTNGESKCEVTLLRIDPPSSSGAAIGGSEAMADSFVLILLYRLYTKTEQEPQPPPVRAKVYGGSGGSGSAGHNNKAYSMLSNKFFQRERHVMSNNNNESVTWTVIYGELKFLIPMQDVHTFVSTTNNNNNNTDDGISIHHRCIRFVYDDGSPSPSDPRRQQLQRWSEAKLTLPDTLFTSSTAIVPIAEAITVADSIESVNPRLPRCPYDTEHNMIISDNAEGGYRTGYVCDRCGRNRRGLRWFCLPCTADYCFDCEPLRLFSDLRCGVNPHLHAMSVCMGDIYGSRKCDLCDRRRLQDDLEFYCCRVDDYDLCLCCASEQQVLIERHRQ